MALIFLAGFFSCLLFLFWLFTAPASSALAFLVSSLAGVLWSDLALVSNFDSDLGSALASFGTFSAFTSSFPSSSSSFVW